MGDEVINDSFEDNESLNETISDAFEDISTTHEHEDINHKKHVFLMKGDSFENIKFIDLPHPKTGRKLKYIINNNELLQIEKANPPFSSFFIDNEVVKNGYLYITTPVDPLFLIIDHLVTIRQKTDDHAGIFMSKEDIFSNSSLELLFNLCDISIICDIRDLDDTKFYRLNDDKVFEWLKRKVEYTCECSSNLKEPLTLMKARTAGYKTRDEAVSTEDILQFSLGILSDFVKPNWINSLKEFYGIKDYQAKFYEDEDSESLNKKRKRETSKVSPSKKQKVSAHKKRLEKINTKGMSNIMGFFKK